MTTIIDRSYNKETGTLEQFTVIRSDGQPDLVKATPENELLYDPEDKLPFKDGLHGFLQGEEALVLSDGDPEIIVAPTNNEYCYILRVRGNTVESTPRQSEGILRGIRDAAIDKDFDELLRVYDEIMSTQVRRHVINALHKTFEEDYRIEQTPSGWLIDEFFLVDWTASMYYKHNDPDKKDVIRSGSKVVEADRSYEFIQLNLRREIEPVEISIGGETYRLTEREMLFLSKVKWLLNRRHYHPDEPFWKFVDRRAAVDWKTGESTKKDENDDKPDLDGF